MQSSCIVVVACVRTMRSAYMRGCVWRVLRDCSSLVDLWQHSGAPTSGSRLLLRAIVLLSSALFYPVRSDRVEAFSIQSVSGNAGRRAQQANTLLLRNMNSQTRRRAREPSRGHYFYYCSAAGGAGLHGEEAPAHHVTRVRVCLTVKARVIHHEGIRVGSVPSSHCRIGRGEARVKGGAGEP